MNDLFKAQAERLKHCLSTFQRSEGQVGLLVFINGQAVGFDIVSRPEVYARLHEKLVRSYVLDALFDEPPAARPAVEAPSRGRAFINSLEESKEEVFASAGYGSDHRFSHTIPGTAQRADQAQLTTLRRRRHFRQN